MMSKHLSYIIPTLVALILYSCAGESMDKNVAATESAKIDDDISEEFFSGIEEPNTELTSEQLEAFQLRAIQKFYDLTDYMEIISDPGIEEDLIEHSLNLVEELFINDSITKSSTGIIWNYAFFNSANGDSLSRTPLIKQWPQIFIKTKTIEFITPLELDSSNKYSGTMKASFIINGKKATNNIGVHLVEIEKFFGDSSQFITEVRLGNIY